mgnify:CR=1 FL=1
MPTVRSRNNLNVKKNNLNNKRLSRLQGVILKALATNHPHGVGKRGLSMLVAHLYGNSSVITWEDRHRKRLAELAGMKQQEIEKPSLGGTVPIIEELESVGKIIGKLNLGGKHEWLSPKFSVSAELNKMTVSVRYCFRLHLLQFQKKEVR